MCWATHHSSSAYYDVWSWLSTWLGWEALGKLVKNTLLGVSVEVYLETKGMRVSKLSEKEYIKCGYHTALGAIGFSALFSTEQRRRRKLMRHPCPALFKWVCYISFPSWTWSSHSSSLSLCRPTHTSNFSRLPGFQLWTKALPMTPLISMVSSFRGLIVADFPGSQDDRSGTTQPLILWANLMNPFF